MYLLLQICCFGLTDFHFGLVHHVVFAQKQRKQKGRGEKPEEWSQISILTTHLHTSRLEAIVPFSVVRGLCSHINSQKDTSHLSSYFSLITTLAVKIHEAIAEASHYNRMLCVACCFYISLPFKPSAHTPLFSLHAK